VLLLACRYHRHHNFHKGRTFGTLCARVTFVLQEPRTACPLSCVVRWLHILMACKRPRGTPPLEYLRAYPDWPQVSPKARRCQSPVTYLMPPVPHLAPLGPQGFPYHCRVFAAGDHRLDMPSQMRSTTLPAPGGTPAGGMRAIDHHRPALGLIPQEILRYLSTARQPPQQNGDTGADLLPPPCSIAPWPLARVIDIGGRSGTHTGPSLGHRRSQCIGRRLYEGQ
jgi:hypothetical protein